MLRSFRSHPAALRLPSLVSVLLLALSPAAYAARPFVVDDARVVDRGACQLEAWRRNNADDSHEYWAIPACNVKGLELTLGGGYLSPEPAGHDQTDYQFQAKTLFKELEVNGWGWGIAAGALRHADINLQQNLIGNYYFYVPISRSLLDDRIVVLGNVGGIDNRDAGRRGMTWGLGGEFYVHRRFMLAAEAYGATGFERFAQVGVRLWIVPDHVQLDASYGGSLQRFHDVHWNSIGIRLISKPFF